MRHNAGAWIQTACAKGVPYVLARAYPFVRPFVLSYLWVTSDLSLALHRFFQPGGNTGKWAGVNGWVYLLYVDEKMTQFLVQAITEFKLLEVPDEVKIFTSEARPRAHAYSMKEEGRRFGGCLSGWPCPIL